MDLFDRMFNTTGGKIPVHTFHAALVDYAAGQTTRNQIVAALSLDADAQADLDVLLAAVDALTGVTDKIRFAVEFQAVALLAETGLKYNTKSAFASRLGL